MAGRPAWSLDQTYTIQKNTNMNQFITFSYSTKYRDSQNGAIITCSKRFCFQSGESAFRMKWSDDWGDHTCSHVHIKLFMETFDTYICGNDSFLKCGGTSHHPLWCVAMILRGSFVKLPLSRIQEGPAWAGSGESIYVCGKILYILYMYETIEFRDFYSNMKVKYRVSWPHLADLSGTTLGSHEKWWGEA